MSRPR